MVYSKVPQPFLVESTMTPFHFHLHSHAKHFSCQLHRKCTGAHKLQNNTHCCPLSLSIAPSQHIHLALQHQQRCCCINTKPTSLHSHNVSSVFFLVYSFLSVCDLPVALSSYLRQTAPVQASLTSWGLQVSQPSPPSPRRSAPFLPRGSAPSAHAHTVWLTATRSVKSLGR